MNITPCAECNEWNIFENMKIIGNELYCDACYGECEEVFGNEHEVSHDI